MIFGAVFVGLDSPGFQLGTAFKGVPDGRAADVSGRGDGFGNDGYRVGAEQIGEAASRL